MMGRGGVNIRLNDPGPTMTMHCSAHFLSLNPPGSPHPQTRSVPSTALYGGVSCRSGTVGSKLKPGQTCQAFLPYTLHFSYWPHSHND